nr:hypothetical protein [Tanacetum cinerariifolium]
MKELKGEGRRKCSCGGDSGGAEWWCLGKTILDVIFYGMRNESALLVAYPGASTILSYSPGPSTPPSYSLGPSRNDECSNCKLLIGKIKVPEATLKMSMHPENHTLDSTALLHNPYNDMGNSVWCSFPFSHINLAFGM